MINTQKLLAYLAQTPFPADEKKRLMNIALHTNEEGKARVYQLAALFVDRFERAKKGAISIEQVQQMKQKSKNFRRQIRQKGEEIFAEAEGRKLQSLENELKTL